MVKHKPNNLHRVISLIGSLTMVLMFAYSIISIQNSDLTIGAKIAKENYSDKGEWAWAMGEFLGMMGGWYLIINWTLTYYEWAWKSDKKKKEAGK